MKSIRVAEFGGPGNLRLETVEGFGPAPGRLVVQIRAAGVNPVDTYIRAGAHWLRPSLPYTPGFDGAGIVVGVGEGVRRFARGDRVYVAGTSPGTYAEFALCPEAHVHPLPANVSFAQGAAIGIPYATAYRALFQIARARPGESVLVRGASGAVGTAALQLGRAFGLTLIATAGSPTGRRLASEQGAALVLDHAGADFVQGVLDSTRGQGPDVILEMRADLNLGEDLRIIGERGRVVIVGSRGNVEITPRDAMVREAVVHSVFFFKTPAGELARIHAALVAALESGVARPAIGRELPLAEAAAAHEALGQPPSPGKIVLVPST